METKKQEYLIWWDTISKREQYAFAIMFHNKKYPYKLTNKQIKEFWLNEIARGSIILKK